MDVTEGGYQTLSLIHKNIYVNLFIDSCTRKLIKHFTRNIDDKVTLRALELFYKEVLSYLPEAAGCRFFTVR